MEDFLMSSMAAQHGALAFIDEGSTRRKEIIAKFLDLEIFEKKFKLAKEDSVDLKGALKRLEGKEFDALISEASELLNENEFRLKKQEKSCEVFTKRISKKQKRLKKLDKKIDSIPAKIVDVVKLRKELQNKENQCISLEDNNEKLMREEETKGELINAVKEFLDSINIEEYENKEQEISSLNTKIGYLYQGMMVLERDVEHNKYKSRLLDNIPCGDSYPSCKFIKDAHVAIAKLPESEGSLGKAKEEINRFKAEVDKLDSKKIYDTISNYEKATVRKNKLSEQIGNIKLQIEKNNVSYERLQKEISELNTDIKTYEDNKEAIENLEQLMRDKNSVVREIASAQKELASCQNEVLELYKSHGSLEEKLKSLKELKEEFHNLR